jgi:hypothetical protein
MATFRTTLSRMTLGAVCLLLGVALLRGDQLCAQELSFGDTAAHTATLAEFLDEVTRLQGVVAACAASSEGCDAMKVGPDERVGAGSPDGFEMHWQWLRGSLAAAKTGKAEDRARFMREAQAQLSAMARETGSPVQTQGFAQARGAANDVLRSPEFEGNVGTTWWDRFWAKVRNLVADLFNGVDALGAHAPWIGTLLEWLLFAAAAVGLLVFLLRAAARQRMRLALERSMPAATAWEQAADDWARMAEEHAAAGAWREAVHCLYWAAIVLLESRRAWRHNPTRTPREYVRLLKPGSAQQQGLRGLTQSLERSWYGQREATAEDYQRAQGCFRQLSSEADGAATIPAGTAEVSA